jgi:hypothetical protein
VRSRAAVAILRTSASVVERRGRVLGRTRDHDLSSAQECGQASQASETTAVPQAQLEEPSRRAPASLAIAARVTLSVRRDDE